MAVSSLFLAFKTLKTIEELQVEIIVGLNLWVERFGEFWSISCHLALLGPLLRDTIHLDFVDFIEGCELVLVGL